MRDIPFSEETVERMARRVHNLYREHVKATADAPLAKTDWDDLDEHFKEDNRELIRDLPNKLHSQNLIIVRADDPRAIKSPNIDLDKAAEEEHVRWMKGKLAVGWTYGPTRDDAAKKHPALLLWNPPQDESERRKAKAAIWPSNPDSIGEDVLPDEEKVKDYQLAAIPEWLAAEGFGIAPLENHT